MAEKTIFDILNDISSIKTGRLFDEQEMEKIYNSYMINRFLSMDSSTLMLANFMNKNWTLPKKIQYLFYIHAIDKKKRFFQFKKGKKKPEHVKIIQEYFLCNVDRAHEYIKILTPEQIEEICEKYASKIQHEKRRKKEK